MDSVLGWNDKVKVFIKHDFRIIIGDGQDKNFWGNNWIGRGELRMCFLRIFALSRVKSGPLIVLGDGRWRWNIELRRRVFDWEIDIWEDFKSTLDEVILVERMKDRLSGPQRDLASFRVGSSGDLSQGWSQWQIDRKCCGLCWSL